MEIYRSKKEFLHKTKFPKYNSKEGFLSFFAYLFSLLIWLFVLVVGLVAIYTYWFSRNLVYLMSLISQPNYRFPFWMALLLVLLFFPLTLAVIFIATLIKIFQNKI